MAAIETRTGDPASAERRLNRPATRARQEAPRGSTALLAGDAARARRDGQPPRWRRSSRGSVRRPRDPVLENERGGLLALRGDFDRRGARVAGGARSPGMNSARLRERRGDRRCGAATLRRWRSRLSTARWPWRTCPAERQPATRAIQLALASEPDGISRGRRASAKLARAIGAAQPDDAWAALVLARASTQLGQKSEARDLLSRVETHAPGTPMAAPRRSALGSRSKSRMQRFAVIEATLLRGTWKRAGEGPRRDRGARATPRDLARRLARVVGGVGGRADARGGSSRRARRRTARSRSRPGCSPAHAELASVAIGLRDGPRAVMHAEKTIALEGEQPRLVKALGARVGGGGAQRRGDRRRGSWRRGSTRTTKRSRRSPKTSRHRRKGTRRGLRRRGRG